MSFDRRTILQRLFIPLWLGTLLLLAPLVTTLLRPTSTPGEFVVGIGTHDPQAETLGLIRDAGISSLRDDIRWSQVEQTRNIYAMPAEYDRLVDEALRNGIQPLLILCYGNKFYDRGLYPTSPEGGRRFCPVCGVCRKTFRQTGTGL